MICEKCQNDYPATYYFATPTICKSCFEKLPAEEKERLSQISKNYASVQTLNLRVGFGKRFLAALIDTLILAVLVLIFFKFSGFFESYLDFFREIGELGDTDAIKNLQDDFIRGNRLNFAFPAILYLLYFLSEVFTGASLGKYLLGLKIAKINGEPADSNSLWLRYIVKNSGSLLTLLWVATMLQFFYILNSMFGFTIFFGFLLILGRNKQNLQDMVAKTAVFKVEDLEMLWGIKKNIGTNIGL